MVSFHMIVAHLNLAQFGGLPLLSTLKEQLALME
jgi:hypothetical protein